MKLRVLFWEFFYRLGKTFILPISLLSCCGIIMGVGNAFLNPHIYALIPSLNHPFFTFIFTWMKEIGSFAFQFLPALFAMAIPLGLSRNEKHIAAFSGFIGYSVFNLGCQSFLLFSNHTTKPYWFSVSVDTYSTLGILSINTGLFGAVFVGVIVYFIHDWLSVSPEHPSAAFLGTTYLTPIATLLIVGVPGLFVPLLWPLFEGMITPIGHLIQQSHTYGTFLFGMSERLLLPLGLHHVFTALIQFTELGGSLDVCGKPVQGVMTIFQAELACPTTTLFSETATRFLSQGKMPSFWGGLPGGALAIYFSAQPENRSKIKGLLLTSVAAGLIGGITEPLEFLFLFASPFLYMIHAIMTGFSFLFISMLGVTIGNTNGNIIDFIVFGVLQGTRTKWYYVPFISILWFLLYYFIFRASIDYFNIKTPGRECKNVHSKNFFGQAYKPTSDYDTCAILSALGGTQNILKTDNCITRLRLILKNTTLINEEALKTCRILGVVHLDEHHIQVIIGPQAQLIRNEIEQLLKTG